MQYYTMIIIIRINRLQSHKILLSSEVIRPHLHHRALPEQIVSLFLMVAQYQQHIIQAITKC